MLHAGITGDHEWTDNEVTSVVRRPCRKLYYLVTTMVCVLPTPSLLYLPVCGCVLLFTRWCTTISVFTLAVGALSGKEDVGLHPAAQVEHPHHF